MLDRHRAKATFFTVGAAVKEHTALMRRIVRDGHGVGNHTYSHADLTRLSPPQFFSEVDRAQAAIAKATRRPTRLLRPPYGAVDSATAGLAARRGYRLVLWDVDPRDWQRPGAAAIASNVIAGARSGAIVLMHDGGGDRSQTVAALETVLDTLETRGYRFAAMR